jgi:hypothetical protein
MANASVGVREEVAVAPQNNNNNQVPRPQSHRSYTPMMPRIMPAGRSLGALLGSESSNGPTRRELSRKKQRKKKGKEPQTGWTNGGWQGKGLASAYLSSYLDEDEIDSMNKLGQRKQRRWQNDVLLRAMAPDLTAEAIDGLFKPVPFGDVHPPSVFYQVGEDVETQALWSMFLSVNSDKQARVLEKWEAHVQELKDEAHSNNNEGDTSGLLYRRKAVRGYMDRWHVKVSSTGRTALKKAPSQTLQDIEHAMLPCLFGKEDCVDLVADDGFGRLLTHSIAQFHGLKSMSTVCPRRGRYVKVTSMPGVSPPEVVYVSITDFLFALSDENVNLSDVQRTYS